MKNNQNQGVDAEFDKYNWEKYKKKQNKKRQVDGNLCVSFTLLPF